jgi:hypothetical protein
MINIQLVSNKTNRKRFIGTANGINNARIMGKAILEDLAMVQDCRVELWDEHNTKCFETLRKPLGILEQKEINDRKYGE